MLRRPVTRETNPVRHRRQGTADITPITMDIYTADISQE